MFSGQEDERKPGKVFCAQYFTQFSPTCVNYVKQISFLCLRWRTWLHSRVIGGFVLYVLVK